eukprot:CAMPEP_0177500408 /NCGR_PEP_ID=MMETSP0369-20130122/36657_1 /TAXON_ID=447022 ORGANISM="Scrippsiella hangoei-like, Strain SHHI-4" /NCGR_SAMPLE_ID=MMETSP0369 /ASSEMBLY_ACC=CAM_ASM_000364 /LENGTH=391 /DNA_ID=CAMNT_0018977809 /DNA_START=143 /DNA_END=1314 /DNA_ORIENTATION=-
MNSPPSLPPDPRSLVQRQSGGSEAGDDRRSEVSVRSMDMGDEAPKRFQPALEVSGAWLPGACEGLARPANPQVQFQTQRRTHLNCELLTSIGGKEVLEVWVLGHGRWGARRLGLSHVITSVRSSEGGALEWGGMHFELEVPADEVVTVLLTRSWPPLIVGEADTTAAAKAAAAAAAASAGSEDGPRFLLRLMPSSPLMRGPVLLKQRAPRTDLGGSLGRAAGAAFLGEDPRSRNGTPTSVPPSPSAAAAAADVADVADVGDLALAGLPAVAFGAAVGDAACAGAGATADDAGRRRGAALEPRARGLPLRPGAQLAGGRPARGLRGPDLASEAAAQAGLMQVLGGVDSCVAIGSRREDPGPDLARLRVPLLVRPRQDEPRNPRGPAELRRAR